MTRKPKRNPKTKPVDFTAISTEYISGSLSLRKLSAKYSVGFGSLSRRCKAESWASRRVQYRDKLSTKTVRATLNQAVLNRDEFEKKAHHAIDKIMSVLERATANEKNSGELISSIIKTLAAKYQVLGVIPTTRTEIDATVKATVAIEQELSWESQLALMAIFEDRTLMKIWMDTTARLRKEIKCYDPGNPETAHLFRKQEWDIYFGLMKARMRNLKRTEAAAKAGKGN